MKGILEKISKGWVVNIEKECYLLHEADCERLDGEDSGFFGEYGEVEFELVMGYDSVFKITRPFAKLLTNSAKEFDNYADDMRAYVKQYENEEELRKEGAIDFAKWLAKEWMSMWVEDKWLWENVSVNTNDQSNWKGYYTEEELYELYLKSE